MQIITISILIRAEILKKKHQHRPSPTINQVETPTWMAHGRGETFPELRGQTMRPGPECRTTGCASPVKDETIKKLMGYKYGYVEDESISLFYADYIHIMGLWDYHGHMYTYIYTYIYIHIKIIYTHKITWYFRWDDTILVWYSFNDTLNLQVLVSPSNLHVLNTIEFPRFKVKLDGVSRFNDIQR